MEQELLKKRFTELAMLSYERDIPAHTGFLTLEEQDLFLRVAAGFPQARYVLTGGFPSAERRAAVFLPGYAAEEEAESYLAWVRIAPDAPKFAEQLTHRDYLGALMSLGIERDRMGDLLVSEKETMLVCLKEMQSFICDELHEVRHTRVTASPAETPELPALPKLEERSGSVASGRLDCLIGFAFRISRGTAAEVIHGQEAFVNGKLELSPGRDLKPGDVISVRHRGKFIYNGENGTSKKGRMWVTISLYI